MMKKFDWETIGWAALIFLGIALIVCLVLAALASLLVFIWNYFSVDFKLNFWVALAIVILFTWIAGYIRGK